MFKGLGNLASLMKQAKQMGSRMEEVSQQLKEQRATGSSGAELIKVEVNGLGEVLRVSIDPSLVEAGEREMIEELLPAAFNQASAKAKQLHMEAMRGLTDGFDMPGLDEAMSQITGDPPGAPPAT